MSDITMPWYVAVGLGVLPFATMLLSVWFDDFSKKRLAEATDYWRRSSAIWEALGEVPGERFTPEAADMLDKFVTDRTDQRGSLPTDYITPSPPST